MFYSQIILAKKGPLGKVWQAAHWGDKKLGRPAIFATDISATVDTITNPAAPMALRVSGHLLLGVVRIYSRQVKYLIDDCQQAMVKVKMAYTKSSATGKPQNAAIIDIEVNPAGARALNISNFGEYSELDFSHAGIEIPFDLANETAEEDWVPAELEDMELEQPVAPEVESPEVGGDVPQQEEEEWGVFEPFDDEEEEEKSKEGDESTVSDIEKTRAGNESMASETSRRASVLNQTGDSGAAAPNNIENGSLSEPEFPAQDDDFMMDSGGDVMLDDDDHQQPPPHDSLRLSLDDSKDSKDKSGADGPGISFGEEEEGEETKSTKKRKSEEAKKKKKKKKRKVITDFGNTELSSEHIRNMLADTSSIVRKVVHPATWVPGQKKTKRFGLTDAQLLRRHITIEQLLQRPDLARDGNLAPELLELWARNTAELRGEPFQYKLRKKDDHATEETKQEDEEDSMERARRADDFQDEDQEFPPAEDDNEFPDGGGGDNAFLDDEEQGIPFDDSMEEQQEMQYGGDDVMGGESPTAGSKGSMEDVFSLGATNALDANFGEDEDRQTAEETTATWHKNTVRVFEVLKSKMAPKDDDDDASVADHVSYDDLTHGVTRRTAAGVFFEILQLKTLNFVELNQDEAFGDIQISPGVKFHEDPPTTTLHAPTATE